MSYAKTIFPYHTGVIGDLDLQVDDIIEVLEQVDQNWLRGKINDQIGLVPCKFVECLPTVNINQNQSLYIAHTDYRSDHQGDLQFHRGDRIIVNETLPNGWFRGSLDFDLPGTTYRPTGIFPSTFVTLVKSNSNSTNQNETQVSSSQNNLLLFDESPIKFVRVICDIKPNYRSDHQGDLQFHRGDRIIVNETLPNGWFRGSLDFNLPGTTYRPTGIFPSTFVTLVKSNSNSTNQNETQVSSSQNNLLLFDESPIKFVRVICDIKPSGTNELGCFEDEVLAVIEGDINQSEWLIVKNAFNSIGRIKRIFVEPIDDRQSDDENNNLLFVPNINSNQYKKSDKNSLDSIQELVEKEFEKLMKNDNKKEQGENFFFFCI
ncbi:unnamed protein product [Rotaria sp. Silwood1]|nr:unnamed protein product [Rotaria sp. Silwood1]